MGLPPVPDHEEDLTHLELTYTSLIQQYLDVLCVDNATFLAERLVATRPTNHALFLLATCYERQGKQQRAVSILHGSAAQSPCMLYLLAKCCFDMEDYCTAEEALLRQSRKDFRRQQHENNIPTIQEFILTKTPCPVPNGAAGLNLLGKICRKSNRKQRAIEYFRMSLQLDPLMWTSFEALCDLGANEGTIDPTSVFGVQPQGLEFAPPPAPIDRGVLTPSFSFLQTPRDAPRSALRTPVGTASSIPKASLFHSGVQENQHSVRDAAPKPGGTSLFHTPNLTPIPKERSYFVGQNLPPSSAMSQTNTLPRVLKRAQQVASRQYYEPSPIGHPSTASKAQPRSLFLGGIDSFGHSHHQKSFSTILPEESTVGIDSNILLSASRDQGSTRKSRVLFKPEAVSASMARPLKTEPKEIDSDTGGVQEILELFSFLGAALLHLGQFRSKEAIEVFRRLPDEHFHTGWVLHQVGRAYFEMADYQNSIRYLQVMEQLEPHRMKGLEVLSTALWQTKREVELSHLAQRVVDFDRLSAEVWCVVGNCFSLQKEHETALTFFRRSIQLDPSFTYSHTLSGHEYFANEDFGKAIACYRDAIRADERHYNAWYGLGAVYFRQEKFDLAEYHFQKACEINPQSSVLICHLGMAQNANGKPYEALETLSAAFRIQPQNPQAHYQRAMVYHTLDRHEEALMDLEKVRDAAPREAQVHFSMGRALKRMGRTEKAMRCFLNALDLDPKDTNLIKAAMEKMDEPEIDGEISAY